MCYFNNEIVSPPTLWDPMDSCPPGSSVHGISQARILKWIAISSSRGSSSPRDQTHVSWAPAMAGKFFSTESTGNPTPIFFLLDPLSLRATKWPRDEATHTKYTTIKTSIGAPNPWRPPGCPIKEGNTRNLGNINGLGSRNKTTRNHPSVIKAQRFRTT